MFDKPTNISPQGGVMMQVRRQNPIHADLARSMPLRFPVQSRSTRGFRPFMQSCSSRGFRLFMQSCSMCGFRTFHAKPQFACFRTFASHANAVSGKCAFPCKCGSRRVQLPVRMLLPGECTCAGILQTGGLFLASTCASVR